MGPTLRHPEPRPAVSAEIGRAWTRYLRETRAAAASDYPVVEERAWQRLVSNLEALGTPLEQREPAPRA